MTALQIAEELRVSVRMVRIVTDALIDCGILVETLTDDVKENAYLPTYDIHQITVSFVLDKLDNRGKGIITQDPTVDFTSISNILDKLASDLETNDGNKLLIEI